MQLPCFIRPSLDTDGRLRYIGCPTSRGGEVVSRRAHNPKIGGSNPPPATLNEKRQTEASVWRFLPIWGLFRQGRTGQCAPSRVPFWVRAS